MSRQTKLINVCSIHRKEYDCEYVHGFCEPFDPHKVRLPREYVSLHAAVNYAKSCFSYDSGDERGVHGVGWRVWWVLLYDEVHHKLLRQPHFTGHQLELDVRHIDTDLTRWEHLDMGGDPQDLLDPWQWMMGRQQIKLAYYDLCDSGLAGYGQAEERFLCAWSCSI